MEKEENDKDKDKNPDKEEPGQQRSQSKSASRTPIKGEARRGESEARGSPPMEEYPSEPADSGPKKPIKRFLKRKTRKVESKKISWGKVPKRIDCWNPKQKDAGPRQAEKKKLVEREREAVLPAHRANKKNMRRTNTGPKTTWSPSGEEESKQPTPQRREPPQRARRGRKPRKAYPQQNPPTGLPQEETEKLEVEELTNVYLLYHGDNQGTPPLYTRGRHRDILRARCGGVKGPGDAARGKVLQMLHRRHLRGNVLPPIWVEHIERPEGRVFAALQSARGERQLIVFIISASLIVVSLVTSCAARSSQSQFQENQSVAQRCAVKCARSTFCPYPCLFPFPSSSSVPSPPGATPPPASSLSASYSARTPSSTRGCDPAAVPSRRISSRVRPDVPPYSSSGSRAPPSFFPLCLLGSLSPYPPRASACAP